MSNGLRTAEFFSASQGVVPMFSIRMLSFLTLVATVVASGCTSSSIARRSTHSDCQVSSRDSNTLTIEKTAELTDPETIIEFPSIKVKTVSAVQMVDQKTKNLFD